VTFIPLAEYSGLIVDIGAWVLEQSCQQLQRLSDLCFDNLRVAINVSMPQFRNSNFVDEVEATVKRFGIKPESVELEITESVVMDDPKLVVKALENLKSAGFSIAIDDFGTGFSSLSYLQQLPLDRLKVDREFIKGIGEGDPGIIAETVINLGQKLGLETIAEGIENEHQLNWVNDLGCDESQGYFHAKPMPAKELEAFLAENCKPS
jgi:EAL domain-containing protein (putative c-di-GMP-specific phosphodiesterase class I)